MKIVLGIGGSSGSIYAQLFMEKIAMKKDIHMDIVMSKNAIVNWNIEIGELDLEQIQFTIYKNSNFMAPFASGSAKYDAMVVCPCSMGLLGRMAAGTSRCLMTRAADVMLKERRRLVVVPRETPLNLIHIQNMERLTQAGAIICPASPSFYSKPTTMEDACMTVVDRVIDLIGITNESYRWGG